MLDAQPVVRRLDEQQTVGVVIRKRLEQDAIDDAEDGGVEADAEGQARHGDGRDTPAVPQAAQRLTHILNQHGNQYGHARTAFRAILYHYVPCVLRRTAALAATLTFSAGLMLVSGATFEQSERPLVVDFYALGADGIGLPDLKTSEVTIRVNGRAAHDSVAASGEAK